MEIQPIKRALISVFDKKGIAEFAKKLQNLNVEILSTGGTFKLLQEKGIKVTEVSSYTKFPEMMDGRVKTLHPKIHGGILALRDNKNHLSQLTKNEITPIDLIVVNLYPFHETVKKGLSEDETIEMIDIGGPSMLRSAAKNFRFVTALSDTADYKKVLQEIKKYRGTTLKTRARLAAKVFNLTALYDQQIGDYLSGDQRERLKLEYRKVANLRYGENPHQKAAFFESREKKEANVTTAKVIGGKQLSFNNILDSDAAIELVREFNEPTAVFVKHTNPCGVASDLKIENAFRKAHQVDPISAFGCVIALNRTCNEKIIDYLFRKKIFVEIIAAPAYEKAALKKLKEKKNLRILQTGTLYKAKKRQNIKKVAGGLLVQNDDILQVTEKDLKIVTKRKPSKKQIADMLFARNVVKHVKSNAVVFAKNKVTTGIGAGQMSRVDSVFIASHKGGKKVPGSVMASDAFFPFSDGVEEASRAGIKAIIQPGGSVRDPEVIKRADELGITMVFSGVRSFKH